jgi:hypothetical protein
MRKPKYILSVLTVFLIMILSCKSDHFKVKTYGIKVEIRIKRFEKDLFTANPTLLGEVLPGLKNKYGSFLRYFSSRQVINIGEINDTSWIDGLRRFATDKLNNQIFEAVISKYKDISGLEEQLTDAFKHYRYYFPAKTIPEVYTYISGFNASIITADSILGIGLDKYLGSDSKFYPALGIYKYQTLKMTPDNIVPDCMYAWATHEWDFKDGGYTEDNVLAEIIHEGKLYYFVKSMIPDYQEDLIFGFTPEQMKFCYNNEGQMWQYLVENNLLFNTEQLTRRKLLGEAPFTSYFTKESPGKAAAWIGFRIVNSYMLNSKDVSLEHLLKNNDVQSILQKARYSPK